MGEWRAQVFLVGAGPGDPGLLTRRGEACLRRADVIYYDHLTNPALLRLAAPKADKVYIGKEARGPRPEQNWINERLIADARAGRIVVRFKGGDSFVFGRGGEEVEALIAAGVRFEVVPGVTSAIAVPACAGVPVTFRGVNTSFHVAVGFEDPDDEQCSVDWELLGKSGQTVVIMMATAHLPGILRRLKRGGLADSTPIATIRWGTHPHQQSKRTTLGVALADPSRAYLPPPSVTVVGGVAGLDERLNWFEHRPLFGRRLIITRPIDSDEGGEGSISDALGEAGARVEQAPAIRLLRISDSEAVDSAGRLATRLYHLREAGGWLILPSPAAIRFFFERLSAEGMDARALAGVRVAVVGARSAEALAERGIIADLVPDEPSGAALAEAIPANDGPPGLNCALIAGSRQTRPELADGLRARGFEVGHEALYSPDLDAEGLATLASRLADAERWTVIVFSPSAAEAIYNHLMAGDDSKQLLERASWCAIGSTTAAAMRRLGFAEPAIAASPTADGLIEALAASPLAPPAIHATAGRREGLL